MPVEVLVFGCNAHTKVGIIFVRFASVKGKLRRSHRAPSMAMQLKRRVCGRGRFELGEVLVSILYPWESHELYFMIDIVVSLLIIIGFRDEGAERIFSKSHLVEERERLLRALARLKSRG